MKTHIALIVAVLTALVSTQAADTPAAIASDYRSKAETALQRVNTTLDTEAAKISQTLLALNDAAAVATLAEQVQAKRAGEPVAQPVPQAAQLFAAYDRARVTALAPVQDTILRRIEAMLASSDGKKTEIVAALAKVKSEIETLKTPPSTRAFLKQHSIPKKWGYYLTAARDKKHGTLTLKDDGTFTIEADSPASGTWSAFSPQKISVDIQNAAKIEEKTEIILEGKLATIKRVSGTRYLKAE